MDAIFYYRLLGQCSLPGVKDRRSAKLLYAIDVHCAMMMLMNESISRAFPTTCLANSS